MTPEHRSLAADVLAFDLGEEMQIVRDELAAGRARIARTLVKEGPLRLTLVGLGPGGALFLLTLAALIPNAEPR